MIMLTAKIFENGRSQAVRLPKEYRFEENEVFINKIGDIVLMIPKNNKWDSLDIALKMFSEDYMVERNDSYGGKREEL